MMTFQKSRKVFFIILIYTEGYEDLVKAIKR